MGLKKASVVSTALLSLTLAACGSGGERGGGGGGLPGAEGSAGQVSSECADVELEATETGVTDSTITITIGADTGSQAIPGMANGSVEAVEAWADQVNKNGGLACRTVEVRHYDSKIDPTESKNAVQDACDNSVAMVGSFMLAFGDPKPLATCEDKAGEATGLPDLPAAGLVTNVACNPTTFLASGGNGDVCPPQSGRREMTYPLANGELVSELIGGEGKGGYVLASTSPLTIATSLPNYRIMQEKQGLTAIDEIGAKGTDTQSHFTPFVKKLKEQDADFVFTSTTFPGIILLLKEAQAQGLDTEFICSSTCYDPAFFKAGGDSVIGTHATLANLPFEEGSENEAMQTFLDNVETHNTFSTPSWIAALLFQQAVEATVEEHGPNGLTRANLLASLENIKEFDAGGMHGKVDPTSNQPSPCAAMVTLGEDGAWERTFPKEPGTFHCSETATITLDPQNDFKG